MAQRRRTLEKRAYVDEMGREGALARVILGYRKGMCPSMTESDADTRLDCGSDGTLWHFPLASLNNSNSIS